MLNLSRKAVSAVFALGLAGAPASPWMKQASAASPPPAPAYEPSDQVCMTYYDQLSSSGSTRVTTGKACRGPDGQWRPAELAPSVRSTFSSGQPVNSAVLVRHPSIH